MIPAHHPATRPELWDYAQVYAVSQEEAEKRRALIKKEPMLKEKKR